MGGPEATITVVGVAGVDLPPAAGPALAQATLVVGGRRHLALATGLITTGTPTVELGPLRAGLAALRSRTGPAVVLASGDPGWFGVVRALDQDGLDPLRIVPAVTSLARLAAAAGRPWDDVETWSAHGRAPGPAVNAARALPAVAVLTGPDLTVAALAAALDGWPRQLTVGERLGYPDEQVTTCPAAVAATRTWAEPNLVLVTDPTRDRQPVRPPAAPDAGWALPEAAYDHRDSMITKAEVRALAVARLAPAAGRLIWDVGAGSGSVGIECARHRAAVVCVEADPDACRRIEGNAGRHDAAVRVVAGRAPQALAGLPAPDAGFVGGGGPAVVEAVAALLVPRVVVACAALDHTLAARRALRAAGYEVTGVQLAASRLAELPGGAVRLAAGNPTFLLTADTGGTP